MPQTWLTFLEIYTTANKENEWECVGGLANPPKATENACSLVGQRCVLSAHLKHVISKERSEGGLIDNLL